MLQGGGADASLWQGRGQAGESGQRGLLLAGGTLEAVGQWGGTPTL